jgi:hypothetical protein
MDYSKRATPDVIKEFAQHRTFRQKLGETSQGDFQVFKGNGVPFECAKTGEPCSSKNCPIDKDEK